MRSAGQSPVPKAVTAVVGAILIFLGVVWSSPSCRVVRSFDNFERNARKVIGGQQLSAWGASVLAQYPTNTNLRPADLGTNFPPQLLKLAPELGPNIVVYAGDGTNTPGWIMVSWGSGFLGHCGFEIGPTNFTGSRAHNCWSPGVYSWNDHGH